MVVLVTRIVRQAEPTPFAAEASCRHGLRAGLCLRGWRWPLADAVAADLVAGALRRIGARRPTWKEGQPEWTQDGALPIERERCVRCRKPLPDGHWKFCGRVCSDAYHDARANAWRAAETLARRLARAEAARR